MTTPRESTVVSVAKTIACEEPTTRYARAVLALFAASYFDPVISWEKTVLPTFEGLFRVEDARPVWVALSIFRFAGIEASVNALNVFTDRVDQFLVLQLALAFEVQPDNETFAHCLPSVLIDLFDLDNDEIRRALQEMHAGSTVWDDHLREIGA